MYFCTRVRLYTIIIEDASENISCEKILTSFNKFLEFCSIQKVAQSARSVENLDVTSYETPDYRQNDTKICERLHIADWGQQRYNQDLSFEGMGSQKIIKTKEGL